MTVDSTIVVRGESEPQNSSDPTSPYSSTTPTNTPVRNSTTDSDNGNDRTMDSTTSSAQLLGKPLSKKEIELVKNTFALTKSWRKTVELLWGKWNPSRDAWAKQILDGGFM